MKIIDKTQLNPTSLQKVSGVFGNINVSVSGAHGFSISHSGAAVALFLCSLNSGCAALHNVIRRSQETPQGLFNLLPPSLLLTLCWFVARSG